MILDTYHIQGKIADQQQEEIARNAKTAWMFRQPPETHQVSGLRQIIRQLPGRWFSRLRFVTHEK
jgi:hypothetical protein